MLGEEESIRNLSFPPRMLHPMPRSSAVHHAVHNKCMGLLIEVRDVGFGGAIDSDEQCYPVGVTPRTP